MAGPVPPGFLTGDSVAQTRAGFDEAVQPGSTVFEQYPSASWTVVGITLVFPVQSICEEGGNRIVPRERPYRDGAKIDDVGSKAKTWTMQCLFNNTIVEGFHNNGNNSLYPNVLNDLIRSFDDHQTGDLVVPTVGKVRARAVSYTRKETNDARDEASVELKFTQDNEDAIDATAFTLPTVKASLQRLTEAATFSAQSDGVFDLTVGDINEFADNLVAIANFPSQTLQDVDTRAGIVVGACTRVLDAFTSKSNNPKTKARAMLSDPDASVTARRFASLQDVSAHAVAELRANQPSIIRIVLDIPMTIFDVATQFGQDSIKLMELNGGLDLLAIPAGTIVRIYDT